MSALPRCYPHLVQRSLGRLPALHRAVSGTPYFAEHDPRTMQPRVHIFGQWVALRERPAHTSPCWLPELLPPWNWEVLCTRSLAGSLVFDVVLCNGHLGVDAFTSSGAPSDRAAASFAVLGMAAAANCLAVLDRPSPSPSPPAS